MKPVTIVLVFSGFLTLGTPQYPTTCSDEESGSVRLYNIVTGAKEDGVVQICKSGLWYSVCGSSWDCRDGNVACKELGYDQARSAGSFSGSTFGSWSHIDHARYSCAGDEEALQNCSSYSYYGSCYSNAAGVKCVIASDSCCSNHGSLRLVGGNHDTEGVLEYCINEKWSLFCSNFDDEEASVACKQLGYTKYAVFIGSDDYSWHNETDYTGSLFSYFSCSSYATENSLNSCSFHSSSSDNYYYSSCTPSCLTPVAIKCYESGECNNGDIRLMDGYISQEGRVEVCVDGVWGSVCASGWTKSSAYVACKHLGFFNTAPVLYTRSEYGNGNGPIVYSNVQCNGWETSFDQCSKSRYLHFSCSWTAGVLCPDDCNEGDVRLVGGATVDQGTVEVCMNKVWGLISDVGWDKMDAKVVCRQLNYPTENVMALTNSYFGKPDMTIHYSYVLCDGNEVSLASCDKLTHSLQEGRLIYSVAGVAGVSCHKIRLSNMTSTPTAPSSFGTVWKHTSTSKVKPTTMDTPCSPHKSKSVSTLKHASKQGETKTDSIISSASDLSHFTYTTKKVSTLLSPPPITDSTRPSAADNTGTNPRPSTQFYHNSSPLDATTGNIKSDSTFLFVTVVMLICVIVIGVTCAGLGMIFFAIKYKSQKDHRRPLPSVKMSNIYSTLQNEDCDEEETEQPSETKLQEKEKLVFNDEVQS